MKYSELVRQGQVKLFKAGIGDAGVDAWLLLENICKISKTDYFVKMNDEVSDEYVKDYFEAIENEKQAYILGFIYSDGCISYDKHTKRFRITISMNERILLEKICMLMTQLKSFIRISTLMEEKILTL